MRLHPRVPRAAALAVAVALSLTAFLPLPGALAASPPTDPMLRVETGMHGAAINRIALTPDGELITVSDDKTIRGWDPVTGKERYVLRAPMAEGSEGALYALALSPTGGTIAVAGHTGLAWDNSTSIYFFDRASRAWRGRIPAGDGPTDVVNQLAFSPDGKALAIAVNDKGGLRVAWPGEGRVAVVDPDYRAPIVGLSFAADGRLAVASLDGGVRLYDAELKLAGTWKGPRNAKPYSVAFSPDGKRLAVGFLDRASISVIDTRKMEETKSFKAPDGGTGALSSVAWLEGGAGLSAAGTWGSKEGRKIILTWSFLDDEPAGVEVAGDTVTDLRALPDGALAYASAEPSWGIVRDGKLAEHQDRQQADFRDGYDGDGFLVSPDGGVVDFGFRQGGRDRARFSLVDRILVRADGPVEDTSDTRAIRPVRGADEGSAADLPQVELLPSTDQAGGLKVTNWRNGDKPKLGRKTLELEPNERARSVAVLPDGSGALIGTDFFLRFYDKAGRLEWKTEIPGAAWVVNAAPVGGFAIAGLADGSIRWYRLGDGSSALSLYPNPDGRRWIAWTPEGFFDHGRGSERLIGYQQNVVTDDRLRGATFVAVDQMYQLFFRRDLVAKRLRGTGEEEISGQLAKVGKVDAVLDKGLPPTLRLKAYCFAPDTCVEVEPKATRAADEVEIVPTTSPTVTLRFEVQDRGGGVGDIVVRRRGAVVPARGVTRSVVENVSLEEREVALEPGINLLAVSAFTRTGELEANAEEQPQMALLYQVQEETKPNLHVIAVGLNRFSTPDVPELANAVADADGMAETLRKGAGDKFANVETIVLTNEQATHEAVLKAIADVAAKAKPDDTTVVFLAGHGLNIDGKFYFLPFDVKDLTVEGLQATALTQDQLQEALGALPTSRTAMLIDACYSGAFAVGDSVDNADRNSTSAQQLSYSSGRYILAGASSQEEALDGIAGHGVFTSVLLEGLVGKADESVRGNKDGAVDVLELGEYARKRVPDVAAEVGQGHRQRPHFFFRGDDWFPVRSLQSEAADGTP
ncbi:caspase family protein [Zavarzinia sp. CC-PAN008]|uniref:caspase family protein n=1 Tax=Zavarzinia sp. CC-PAN008 TaxID=3243332 RepID=UPI003F74407A